MTELDLTNGPQLGLTVTAPVLSDAARAFAKASLAENTRRAYAAQWKRWLQHCETTGEPPLPAAPVAVANWLASRAMDGRSGGKRGRDKRAGQSIATLRTAVAAVKAIHQAQGLDFDASASELRMTLQGIRRERSEKIEKAAPLRAELLLEVLAGLGDDPIDVRDAALLALGYCFARRRSELVGLDWERLGDGDGILSSSAREMKVELVRHKTQSSEPMVSVVPRSYNSVAVQAVERWLTLAAVQPGEPVLRRVRKGGHIGTERLNDQSVTGIIQRRLQEHFERQGVPTTKAVAEAAQYSGHSLRHGFVATAAEAEASVQAITSVTGHRSLHVVMGYISQAEKSRISPHRIKGVGLGKPDGGS